MRFVVDVSVTVYADNEDDAVKILTKDLEDEYEYEIRDVEWM